MIWQYCGIRIPPRDIDWVHDINRLTHSTQVEWYKYISNIFVLRCI